MWPSPAPGENNNTTTNSNNNKVSCRSPSESGPLSPDQSPTPDPDPTATPTSTAKQSMEEVWKDMNLGSLHDHPNSSTRTRGTSHSAYPSTILRDFLGRPFSRDHPTRVESTTTDPSPARRSGGGDTDCFDSFPRLPATILSLNSGPDFQFLEGGARGPAGSRRLSLELQGHGGGSSVGSPSFGSALNYHPFDPLGSPPFFPSLSKKRPQENHHSGDRRNKRMIKNRESAARSRARKQAYTNELELEVAHLLEENANLKRQQAMLLAAPARTPKKHRLYRTLTAPF